MADIAKEYLLVTAITFIGVLLGYLARIMFVKVGIEEYGTFFGILSLVSVVYGSIAGGVRRGGIYFLSSKKDPSYLGAAAIILLAGIIISLPIMAVADPFSVGPLTYLFASIGMFLQTLPFIWLAGNERIVESSIIQNLQPISILVGLVGLSINGFLGFFVAYSIFWGVVAIFSIRGIPALPRVGKVFETLQYSFSVSLLAISSSVFNYLDRVLLGFFRSASEIGLYEIASPLSRPVSYIISPLIALAFPHASSSKAFARKAFPTFIKISILTSMPVILVTLAYPHLLTSILFGLSTPELSISLRILVISSFFWASFNLIGAFISAVGKPEVPTRAALIFGAINLLADFLAVPMFGFVGASATTMAAAVMSFLYLYWKAGEMGLKGGAGLFRMFIPGLVSFISISISKSVLSLPVYLEVLVVGLIGAASYIISLAFVKPLTKEERKHLKWLPVPGWFVEG